MKSENLKDLSPDELLTVHKEDIELTFVAKDKKKVHSTSERKIAAKRHGWFDKLAGVNNIKNEVNELVKLVRFYNETAKMCWISFRYIFTVFLGNPGTSGKQR